MFDSVNASIVRSLVK